MDELPSFRTLFHTLVAPFPSSLTVRRRHLDESTLAPQSGSRTPSLCRKSTGNGIRRRNRHFLAEATHCRDSLRCKRLGLLGRFMEP